MRAEIDGLYHFYNQGNDRETLFKAPEHFESFLRLTKRYILPVCDILAWCLMPNHFHFCIHANELTVMEVRNGATNIQSFSKGASMLLSTYSNEVNRRDGRTGARFRPHSKLKPFGDGEGISYAIAGVHYIHYNPVEAGLVETPTDWPYSSAPEYAGLRNNGLCNLTLAKALGLFCP